VQALERHLKRGFVDFGTVRAQAGLGDAYVDFFVPGSSS